MLCRSTREVLPNTVGWTECAIRGWLTLPWPPRRNTFYYGGGDLFDVAATYAYHLAESQAFIDGNKRTAIASALVFLARNGAYVTQPTWQLYNAMIQIAEKKLGKAGLADLFRRAAQNN